MNSYAFGEMVKLARLRQGKTVEQMARSLQLKPVLLRRIEDGFLPKKAVRIAKICKLNLKMVMEVLEQSRKDRIKEKEMRRPPKFKKPDPMCVYYSDGRCSCSLKRYKAK